MKTPMNETPRVHVDNVRIPRSYGMRQVTLRLGGETIAEVPYAGQIAAEDIMTEYESAAERINAKMDADGVVDAIQAATLARAVFDEHERAWRAKEMAEYEAISDRFPAHAA